MSDSEWRVRHRMRCYCLRFIQNRKETIVFSGIYSMVVSLVCIIFLTFRSETLPRVYQYADTHGISQVNITYVWMSSYGVLSLCAVLLICGGIKNNRFCLLPWLLFSVVSAVIEFWGLITLAETHASLDMLLGAWEISFYVIFAVRFFIHVICFGLVIIHGRAMFKDDRLKKRAYLANAHRLHNPLTVIPMRQSGPVLTTVSASVDSGWPHSPPPYTDPPPPYTETLPVLTETPAIV